MASNVNDKVYSSLYCKVCGAANPTQATHCFACREPFSNIIGGSGASTNPLTGLLLPDSPNLGGTIYTYSTGSGVLGVAWSPDGMRLAMGDWNGQIQAWDANAGHHVINFYDPSLRRRVEAVTWLPDGK